MNYKDYQKEKILKQTESLRRDHINPELYRIDGIIETGETVSMLGSCLKNHGYEVNDQGNYSYSFKKGNRRIVVQPLGDYGEGKTKIEKTKGGSYVLKVRRKDAMDFEKIRVLLEDYVFGSKERKKKFINKQESLEASLWINRLKRKGHSDDEIKHNVSTCLDRRKDDLSSKKKNFLSRVLSLLK